MDAEPIDKSELYRWVTESLTRDRAEFVRAGQADEVARVDAQLLMFRFLPARPLSREDVVCPGALVKLALQGPGSLSFCLIVPNQGGLILQWRGLPLQVVTPLSPLGEALLGKSVGQQAQLQVRHGQRVYEIRELY